MIFHIAASADYERQKHSGLFRVPSLAREGFIHASWRDQIVGVADRIYAGHTDLVILCIDEKSLEPELLVEDSYGHGAYPHIYGALNVSAVTSIIPFPCRPDGTFSLPEDLP